MSIGIGNFIDTIDKYTHKPTKVMVWCSNWISESNNGTYVYRSYFGAGLQYNQF